MKKLLFMTLLAGFILHASGQTPKEARELNLKTKTTWVLEKKGKKEVNYKKSELRYDKDGNLIQEIEFSKGGDVTRNISYQYDNKNKIREIHFDTEGKIILRIEYVYSRKTLSEIQYYNGRNDLQKKEQFIYEQQD